MSKDPRQFVEIFKCPDCESNLIVDGENMKCEKCERIFPVYNGIAIFLSQEEWREFYSVAYNFDVFAGDKEKELFKELSKKDDYSEIIKLIDKYSGSEERKRSVAQAMEYSSMGINDPEQEKAVIAADDKAVEIGMASNPKMILDWPTGPGGCLRRVINEANKETVIVSSEINLFSIFRLKNYLEEKGLADNIVFVNNDVAKMPFKNNIFNLITVFGLISEVPNSDKALQESYRVMKEGGLIVGTGDFFNEDSPSLEIADEGNTGQVSTKARFSKEMNRLGFQNVDVEVGWEGYDTDNSPDEDRCPLPARGDWFSFVIVKAEK